MTTRKPGKSLLALLLLAALCQPASAALRAKTFDEARQKAGSDGIVVFCYGPDWNKRSVRMLQGFWQSPETEKAAGDAVMLAVPFYQDGKAKGAEEARSIRGGLPAPPFQVCPAVMMLDREGRVYATLTGTDYLGDEKGELGAKNIKAKLEALHRRQQLMKKAEGLKGIEKAKVLREVSDLPIARPEGLMQMIEEADPQDKAGGLRRNRHSQIQFTYKQIEADELGFTDPEAVIDLGKVKQACLEVIEDEAYRPEDRQAAYNVYIGQSRRDGIGGGILRNLIRRGMKIDEETWYGRLSPTLGKLWGSGAGHRKSAAQRSEERRKKRDKRILERRSGHDVEID